MATKTASVDAKAAVDQVLGSLNADYMIEDVEGDSYPWVQASMSKPGLTDTVHLVAPEGSLDRLDEDAREKLELETVQTVYNDELGESFCIKNARWVILAKPSTQFAQNKEDGYVVRTTRGFKYGSEWKSVSRVHLACVVDGEILENEDGDPQVWGLKLTGLKGLWIKNDKEARTIVGLNKALKKAYDMKKGWFTPQVSVALAVTPRKFESNKADKSGKKQSSMGSMFGFVEGDNAIPLSEDNKKKIFDLVTSDDFIQLAEDPFYVGDRTGAPEGVEDADTYEIAADEDPDVTTPSVADQITF